MRLLSAKGQPVGRGHDQDGAAHVAMNSVGDYSN